MLESEEYREDSYNMCVDQQLLTELGSSSNDSKKNSSRKRRFSDDQVKSLECMFETQTKLEPRKKLQLARELGLQPRQVAIWFQNKRARWKSKQLEREYSSLRADYDALLSSFESLEKEQQSLLQQRPLSRVRRRWELIMVGCFWRSLLASRWRSLYRRPALQKLADLLEKPTEGNSDGRATNDNGDTTTAKGGEDGKASRLAAAAEGADLKLMVMSSRAEEEEEEEIRGYSEKQEPDLLLYGGEAADRCLVLADQRCCFNGTGGFSDQSCSTSSQWWEFWPLND